VGHAAWRFSVQALGALRGRASTPKVQDQIDVILGPERPACALEALQAARRLGLVEMVDHRRGNAGFSTWALTALGQDWLDGRVQPVSPPRRKGQRGERTRFEATWLASLPRDVSIQPANSDTFLRRVDAVD
jgi:hypothetical protein